MYLQSNVHMYICTYVHMFTHIYVCTFIRMCELACMHVDTHATAWIQTYIIQPILLPIRLIAYSMSTYIDTLYCQPLPWYTTQVTFAPTVPGEYTETLSLSCDNWSSSQLTLSGEYNCCVCVHSACPAKHPPMIT